MGARTGDGPRAVSREEEQHEHTNTPHLHPDEPGGIRPAEKEKQAAGLSANAWLMRELERNRPILYRKKETRAAIAFADEAGRDITPWPGIQQRLRHRPAVGLFRPAAGPGGGAIPAGEKLGYPYAA